MDKCVGVQVNLCDPLRMCATVSYLSATRMMTFTS